MIVSPTAPAQGPVLRNDKLMQAAEKLEAQFLAQMLKMSDMGKPPASFGCGEGEAQFRSLMCDEQAKAMVTAGGIGMAQQIFDALVQRGRAHDN